MNIGFFTDTYPPQMVNGVAISVGYFVDLLRKAGNSVLVIAPKIRGYKEKDKDVYRIPSSNVWPSFPDSARIPISLPDRVWIRIVRLQYDIIHAHGNGFFSFLGLMIARQKGIPYILTCHTMVKDYAHYFLRGKVLTPGMITRLLKKFCNMSDHLIAPSEKMKKELLSIGVTKPITVIPNFVATDKFLVQKNEFLHEKCGIPKDEKIVLSVGRLGKEKNFAFLIRVFQEVIQENNRVHLLIAGDGPERNNLEKLITELQLEAHVHLIGIVEIADMPYVYADADIFSSASTSEIHPMTVIEAAASGLPLVLVADSAFVREIIPEENGFSLPLNEQKFAEKILLLLSDDTLRKQFGAKSRTIIQHSLKPEALLKQLTNVYEEVQSIYATPNPTSWRSLWDF